MKAIGILFSLLAITSPAIAFASSTNGVIDQASRYAYMESGSWIDLGSSQGGVTVTDAALSGSAWSPEYGWISLNCSNDNSCATVDYKVANDGSGMLSGYSWSETFGWMDWKPTNGGVVIDSNGIFSGRAWSDQVGWVTFNCSADNSCSSVDYKVATDWRPKTVGRAVENVIQSFSSGGSSGSRISAAVINVPQNIIAVSKDIINNVFDAVIPDFLKPKTTPKLETIPEMIVPKIAPLALDGKWQLLPVQAIGDFVLAPLPQGVRALAAKFPSFGKMLGEVGVTRMSDLDKLQGVSLSLPGLTERSGINGSVPNATAFSPMTGIPLAKLSPSYKQSLPSETIFARAGGELIDLNASVMVSDAGDVSQKISTQSGKMIRLAIKPESTATSVKGYLNFLKRDALSKETEYPSNMLASALSALPVFGKKVENSQSVNNASENNSLKNNSPAIEDKLVLLSFDYSDPDNDGIWTADIASPVAAGEYEVMTIIAYADPALGTRQVRLVTVVDPEGYVYEKSGSKETRIPDAVVTIFRLNSGAGTDNGKASDVGTETVAGTRTGSGVGQFEIWQAATYHQENPQTTGMSGTYSFLVPPGTYKITASAPGYLPYEGKSFEVQVGSGVHKNIELIPKDGWLKAVDWKILLLVAVVLLLAYNFYRDYRRSGKI